MFQKNWPLSSLFVLHAYSQTPIVTYLYWHFIRNDIRRNTISSFFLQPTIAFSVRYLNIFLNSVSICSIFSWNSLGFIVYRRFNFIFLWLRWNICPIFLSHTFCGDDLGKDLILYLGLDWYLSWWLQKEFLSFSFSFA